MSAMTARRHRSISATFLTMMLLYWLQQSGNKPITLMGGGTTMVGDPSGKDESRRDADGRGDRGQQGQHSSGVFGEGSELWLGRAATPIMVDNADWLLKLSYIDMLRDVGRHFSVNRMLSMDSVRLRLEREQEMSFIEFNYMVCQSYDFVELVSPHRLQSADGRLGPVGQYRQWRRSRPPHGNARNCFTR